MQRIIARTIACAKRNRPTFESDDQFFTKIEEQTRSDLTHLRSTLCNSEKIRVSIPRKETRESCGANRFCLHDERSSGSGGILDMSPRKIAILSRSDGLRYLRISETIVSWILVNYSRIERIVLNKKIIEDNIFIFRSLIF